MANGCILEVPSYRFIAHPIEIIVGIIVLANMFEAKAEILPFAQAPHWRSKLPVLLAARGITSQPSYARLPLGGAIDADTIEER